MFRRYALVPIGIMEAPAGDKVVFAGLDNEEVSFPYDPDNFIYFRCRAITADASNGNGDYFPEEEIKKAYKSFVGVGLYKDHDSNSVDKSIGKVLWAEWVPSGKYVECYCAVDKQLAPDLAHRVKVGIATSVSMGCAVAEAQCSVCKNIAHNINELCPHMAPNMGVKGRKNSDGTTIYEINRGIQFNELSLVTVPADPTARIFEIYAKLKAAAAGQEMPEQVFKEEPSSLKLLRLKRAYVEMHVPGFGDVTDPNGVPSIDKVSALYSEELEDFAKNNPREYTAFITWIKRNPYLRGGVFGYLSSPSKLEGESEKDKLKYRAYFPRFRSKDCSNAERMEVMKKFYKDISYDDDKVVGGHLSEKILVEKYIDRIAEYCIWADKQKAKMAILKEEAKRTGGISMDAFPENVLRNLEAASRDFSRIFKRFPASARQLAQKIKDTDTIYTLEAKTFGNVPEGSLTAEQLQTAIDTHVPLEQNKIPDGKALKDSSMKEFQLSVANLDAEYQDIDVQLYPLLKYEKERIGKILEELKPLKDKTDEDRNMFIVYSNAYASVRNDLSEILKPGGYSLIDAFNRQSPRKTTGKNIKELTQQDWSLLVRSKSLYEGIIDGLLVKQIREREDEDSQYRGFIDLDVPQQLMENDEFKETRKDKPQFSFETRKQPYQPVKPQVYEPLGMTGASGYTGDIDATYGKSKEKIGEMDKIPLANSEWVRRDDDNILVKVVSADKDKVIFQQYGSTDKPGEQTLGAQVELSREEFRNTYKKKPEEAVADRTYFKGSIKIPNNIINRINDMIQNHHWQTLGRNAEDLGLIKALDWDKIITLMLSEDIDAAFEAIALYKELGLQTLLSDEVNKALKAREPDKKTVNKIVGPDKKTYLEGSPGLKDAEDLANKEEADRIKAAEEAKLDDSKGIKNNDGVIKVYNSLENKMGLSITYDKGASLATSFFVGREGNLVYRVAAAEVLPLPVQEAIMLNDDNVATPDQIVNDLSVKYSKLDEFKKWAKKRKKKTKKVLLSLVPDKDLASRMHKPAELGTCDSKDGRKEMPENKDEKFPKTAAQEETPAPETTVTPVATTEPIKTETAAPATQETVKLEEVKAAFQSLLRIVENRINATAVQVVKMESKIDGQAKVNCEPDPKGAIKEVSKTENPKGHITSALKAEAMDANWTINPKELEKQPSGAKEQQACPPDVSWDLKEMGSEQVKVSNSNKAAGKVKKYYGQLGAGAEGTPELAMDLKSSENTELKMLREALAQEKAEKTALLEKDKLQTVADKIYTIVATLREKGQIAPGTEDVVIDTLTKKFANMESLESLSSFVSALSAKADAAPAPETSEEVKNNVVPQVFETTEKTEDAVIELSQIWNK